MEQPAAVTAEISQRKNPLWFLPGFRCCTAWKSLIAVPYYLFSLVLLATSFFAFLFVVSLPFIVFGFVDYLRLTRQATPETKHDRAFRARQQRVGLTLIIPCLTCLLGITLGPVVDTPKTNTPPSVSPPRVAKTAPAPIPLKKPVPNTTLPAQAPTRKPPAAPRPIASSTKLTQVASGVTLRRGLGATYQQWVNQYGMPNRILTDNDEGYGQASFAGDYYWGVQFVENHAQNITVQLEKYYPKGVSLTKAKMLVAELLPPDAKLLREYTPDSHTNEIGYEYQSNAICNVFHAADDCFFGDVLLGGKVERNKFHVVYQRFNEGFNDNRVFGVLIATGGAFIYEY